MEQITVEIKGCQENIMITSIYRPPNTTSNKFVKEYGDLLTDLKSKGNNIIIGLDHNLDLLKQHVHSCTNEFLQKNFDKWTNTSSEHPYSNHKKFCDTYR